MHALLVLFIWLLSSPEQIANFLSGEVWGIEEFWKRADAVCVEGHAGKGVIRH